MSVLAAVIVAAVSVVAGYRPYRGLGLTDPGDVVRLGTPLLRLVGDLSATMCVGWLVFAVCFTPVRERWGLSAQGYDAVRRAGRWAVVWLVAVVVLVPFDTASIAGQPLARVLSPAALAGYLGALEGPTAWLISAGVVVVVAIGARATLRWRPAVGLLLLALFAVLPPLCTEHSSSDTGHDLATAAILIHVPAAVVWLGVLVAVLTQARAGRPVSESMARRYRRVAAGCWMILVLSGCVDAYTLVPASELLTTQYGLLVLGKTVLVVAVGWVGIGLRSRALRAATGHPRNRLTRLAAGELGLLAAILAGSVGLTHLAPPAFVDHAVTADQTLLGYNLTGPPTLWRLAADWRFEVLFGSLALVLAGMYLLGVRRLRRAGQAWPVGRSTAWLAGCAVLLLATSSGIGRYAAAMFSMHLTSHMLVGMLCPFLLALGGPLTLLRAAVPPAGPGQLPGPREWVDGLAGSRAAALLTHPLVILAVFVAAPFLLYFTSLFDAAVRFHWAHMAIDAAFLAIGYLFAWPAIGIDPTPRPMPTLARLGMLLAAMPADVIFGAAVINTSRVIGNGPAGDNMYTALALPWVHSLLGDQHLAGGLALAIGEASVLLAIGALLWRWQRLDTTTTPELAEPVTVLRDALAHRTSR